MDGNFPNLKKEMSIKVQERYRTSNKLEQKRNSLMHIIIKILNVEKKERILKAARGKKPK